MKRVFQHYTGEVECLKGLKILGLSCLYHRRSGNRDAILFWMEAGDKKWYRIFIDGTYCGVDEYSFNNSGSDLDENLELRNHDSFVKGLRIKSAHVKSAFLPVIKLTISFDNESVLIFDCNSEEKCSLQFINT